MNARLAGAVLAAAATLVAVSPSGRASAADPSATLTLTEHADRTVTITGTCVDASATDWLVSLNASSSWPGGRRLDTDVVTVEEPTASVTVDVLGDQPTRVIASLSCYPDHRASGPETTRSWLLQPSTTTTPTPSTPTPVIGARFVPLAPCRLTDTRLDDQPLVDGRWRPFSAGPCGVPSGASAIAVTATVTEPTGAGFVTLAPDETTTAPTTSTLNFAAGETRANSAIVGLTDGSFAAFARSGERTVPCTPFATNADDAANCLASRYVADGVACGVDRYPACTGDEHLGRRFVITADGAGEYVVVERGSTDLILDVTGYFEPVTTPVAAGRFVPVDPVRLADTRLAGDSAHVVIDAPAGAAAVALNVTLTDSVSAGYATAYPSGTDRPATSSVNVDAPGQTRAAAVIVPVGDDGRVVVEQAHSGGHLVVDLTGWFTDGSAELTVAGLYRSLAAPVRVLDTRGSGPVDSRTIVTPPMPGVERAAIAWVGNVTIVDNAAATYLTVWPAGAARPGTSSVNRVESTPGAVANMAIVGAGAGRSVGVSAGPGAAHAVLDVAGYFLG